PAASTSAQTPTASASVAPPPACPDLAVELPPLISVPALDPAQPEVVDEGDVVMQSFYEKAARVLRKNATDHVRIGVYGDSNMTMDYQTGEMRRVLQTRYGDAGHGFLAAGRPWGWYLHRDIKHDADGRWIAYDVSTDRAPDSVYGFANISMKSKEANALSWLETVDDKHEIGRTFSRFEVYALEQPAGGAFTVTIDGTLLDTVETKADARKPIFRAYDVKDTPHRLELRAKAGNVRLFGTAVERSGPSFVVDSLGVGALNAEQLQYVDKDVHRATLAHRKYDLILDMTGTNMFALEFHPKWMKNVIAMYRSALPDVPILLVSPPDLGHWDKPDLGVVEVAGRRDHNIVFNSDMVPQSPTTLSYGPDRFIVPTTPMTPQGKKAFFWAVNKHPRPRDPSEKYIALAIVQDHRRGAHIAASPDGVRWSCSAAPFWQTPHDVSSKGDDCLMHVFFDEAKQKWALYRRIVPEFSERMIADDRDRERAGVDRYYRSYSYAESEDLKEWKNHQFILAMDADDPADTELYQFACHKFAGIYVGYVSVYHLRRPQPIDIHLATSRDGIHFTRVCRGTPFIPSGPLGYYDYMAMACSQPKPIVVNDTVYIYYAALNFPHDADTSGENSYCTGGAALATLKRDRFISLETGVADAEPCRVITKPFGVRHPRLYLNAATWQKGSIRAEVLTRDWQPIAGFTEAEAKEIQGDALDHPVQWASNADLSKLLGREIRLKFSMTRARIHAMTLSNDQRRLGEVEAEYRPDPQGDSSPKLN
ncbi:MAG: hypothetical protein HUU20_23045, partial [Pirellulales bacterium]|nr:hypothetical protein [Pirellulales bacterium]